jgi:hypothetical protein
METIRIFISYCHDNATWLDEWDDAQKTKPNDRCLLKQWERTLRKENVTFWHDHKKDEGLHGGDKWQERVFEEINRSQIAILLVTQQFATSPFVIDREIPRILDRCRRGQLLILPILLQPTRIKDLGDLNMADWQWLPSNVTSLNEYFERSANDFENAKIEILESLERMIARVRNRKISDSTLPEKYKKDNEVREYGLKNMRNKFFKKKIGRSRKKLNIYITFIASVLLLLLAIEAKISNNKKTHTTEKSSIISQSATVRLTSIEEISSELVRKFSSQLPGKSNSMIISPFTYCDTRITSQFARRLWGLLQTQFTHTDKGQINIENQYMPETGTSPQEQAEILDAEWILSGSYCDSGSKVKMTSNIREAKTTRIIASAEILFDTTIISALGLSIKPQDFENVINEQRAFEKGEISDDKLHIEAWTNKGKDDVLFIKNEIMKLYVRINRPAHIRAMYKLADNRYTLLLDDFYIDESKTNKMVRIPGEFICSAPFGVERLNVIARTAKFDILPVIEKNGYKFIKVNSTYSIIQTAEEAGEKFRGMKLVAKRDRPMEQNEASVVVTTME